MEQKLTAEETAWLEYGESLYRNPIVRAFGQDLEAVLDGETDPEDGLATEEDVIKRWIDYLADGDQDISWHPPILAQANEYFARVAEANGLKYRPGMTHAVA